MHIQEKTVLLEGMYAIYDAFISAHPLACRPGCADCCTCNVTLTTLEGYWVISSLTPDAKDRVLRAARAAAGGRRFQPALTFNEIARRCMNQEDIPEEPLAPDWGACPLLTDNACPVYALRPFGCRCLVSSAPCSAVGHADMDELILTVNHLFLQYIEHIDTPGMTGNLVDVLLFLASNGNLSAYGSGRISGNPEPLTPNRRIPAVMIPPRHRERLEPILNDLRQLLK